MSKSVKRVQKTAIELGHTIEVMRMPESTRTASEAAAACGCSVGQIVKSMVFMAESTGDLKLLLIGGNHNVDVSKAAEQIGESIARADPKRIREETGFAIGGVAPIGHLKPLETWFDESLLLWPKVWAAAGAPNAVFEIDPRKLFEITNAKSMAVD